MVVSENHRTHVGKAVRDGEADPLLRFWASMMGTAACPLRESPSVLSVPLSSWAEGSTAKYI